MDNEIQKTEVPVKTEKKHYIIFDSKTKYYGFRNTRRLAALRWCNVLFVLAGILGALALVLGFGTFALWLILFIITISLISKYNRKWFGFMENCFLYGGLLIAASILLRFLVELAFAGLELLELKANPDGAEKYLKVRRASFKISLINLGLCAVVAGAGYLMYAAGVGKNAETIVFVLAAIAALITSRIFLQRIYRKVSNEIVEIRLERKTTSVK